MTDSTSRLEYARQEDNFTESLEKGSAELLKIIHDPNYVKYKLGQLDSAVGDDAIKDYQNASQAHAEAYEHFITVSVAMRLLHSKHFSPVDNQALVNMIEANQVTVSKSKSWMCKNVKKDWIIMVPDVASRDMVYSILLAHYGDELIKYFDPYRLITVKRMYEEAPKNPSLVLFWNFRDFGKNDFSYRNFCEWLTGTCRAAARSTPLVVMQ